MSVFLSFQGSLQSGGYKDPYAGFYNRILGQLQQRPEYKELFPKQQDEDRWLRNPNLPKYLALRNSVNAKTKQQGSSEGVKTTDLDDPAWAAATNQNNLGVHPTTMSLVIRQPTKNEKQRSNIFLIYVVHTAV